MTGRKGQHCLHVRVCWGLLVEWRSLYEKTFLIQGLNRIDLIPQVLVLLLGGEVLPVCDKIDSENLHKTYKAL